MRSEAISSSRIEGIAPNVDKVVLAELAQEEEVRGFKEGAEEVARNLTVLRSIEKKLCHRTDNLCRASRKASKRVDGGEGLYFHWTSHYSKLDRWK
ncbi:hypothetical protein [Corynebacterium aurimucosum]|uniref:hypothetical protein n=1 Tax=Corynebacterium aurimucosum TaxID=169292 RepID=UPI0037BEF392